MIYPSNQYRVAEALEQDLGDPCNPDNPMSFKQSIDLDEAEAFPQEAIAWLYNWTLQDYYIPVEAGGKFTNFEEFIALVRVLSRRDLTAAITFTTLFWSYLVWMAGTQQQQQRLARFMQQDHGAMCLAYSERAHGSDLVASEVTASKVPGGYVLNGEKWPINRATISGVTFVLAKTDEAGGARSLSLFMVEKSRLDPAAYSNLPKIKTHGIRGSDMSGIRFDQCFVAADSRLGPEGAGLELALKGFQITRTLCAAFSQGAADTALRTTLKFALGRQLYGKTVFEMPQPRRVLVEAFLDILICDCVAIAAARGFSVVPEQFSVWSAVVKYFVPTRLEAMVQDLSVVMGARYYMREAHDWGIFQKVVRDNAIISVFDGSTVVNLHALALQLRQLARYRARNCGQPQDALHARLTTTFSLEQPLPVFMGQKLELFSRGADDVLQGLELAQTHVQQLSPEQVTPEVWQHLIAQTAILREALQSLDQTLTTSTFEYGHDQSPELFDLAKQYCALHAAAACVQMWLFNRERLGEFFARGEWLVLCLRRLLPACAPTQPLGPRLPDQAIAQHLLQLYTNHQLFSIVPIQLAQPDVHAEMPHVLTELQLPV